MIWLGHWVCPDSKGIRVWRVWQMQGLKKDPEIPSGC